MQSGDPGGIRDAMQYLDPGFFPVKAPKVLCVLSKQKLPPVVAASIIKRASLKV